MIVRKDFAHRRKLFDRELAIQCKISAIKGLSDYAFLLAPEYEKENVFPNLFFDAANCSLDLLHEAALLEHRE
jgi:hypothetical protein